MTNQGLFMKIMNSILPKIALFLVISTPLITYAEGLNQEDKFAAAKAEPEGEVPVMKLEDIMAGKYTNNKAQKKNNTPPPPVKKIQKKDKTPPPPPVKKEVKRLKKKVKKEPILKKITPIKTAQPVISKAAVNNTSDADLLKAYSTLMGTPTKPLAKEKSTKSTQVAPTPPPKTANVAKSNNANASTGWLYVGKFRQGQWDNQNNQTLGLSAILPTVGQHYTIRTHSNIRGGYPSKGGMPSVMSVLRKGSRVRLTALHNSGKSGHYWAKIAW